MAVNQPEVARVIVAFTARPRLEVYLTPRDRMDVNQCREPARLAGYDRMVIHEREDGDGAEFGDFVSLHRRGEAWSRWGFARKGRMITAWSCITGADVGEFSSLAEAFAAVLPKTVSPLELEDRGLAVVTDLLPLLRQVAGRLGSAA